MNSSSVLQEELAAINRDLSGSYRRLESLLERARQDLADSDATLSDAERERLERMAVELERKIGELKELGISGRNL